MHCIKNMLFSAFTMEQALVFNISPNVSTFRFCSSENTLVLITFAFSLASGCQEDIFFISSLFKPGGIWKMGKLVSFPLYE